VNEKMLEDLSQSTYGDHASNLGAIIADRFGKEYNKPAFTVNPVVVDELIDEARYTGLPLINRVSAFHALNQKAVAKKAAKHIGIEYEEGNFIVAHLGGGISVGAHRKGKVIDVNNALEEGPFSPERAGSLPTKQLVKLCFSGEYSNEEINKMLVGRGGFYAHTGTTDVKMIMEKAETNESFRKVVNAFTYNLAKEICGLAASFSGDVDRIVITGGLAHSKKIIKAVEERVSFIAPLYVLPGEDELRALEEGVVHVLDGLEETKIYS
jgi:butyrate kinase